MAAQGYFLLCEIWFLKSALGKQAVAVLQQRAEQQRTEGSFSQLYVGRTACAAHQKQKISSKMPLSKSPRRILTWRAFAISSAPLVPILLNIRLRYRRVEFSFRRNKAESNENCFYCTLHFSKRRHAIHALTTSVLHHITGSPRCGK